MFVCVETSRAELNFSILWVYVGLRTKHACACKILYIHVCNLYYVTALTGLAMGCQMLFRILMDDKNTSKLPHFSFSALSGSHIEMRYYYWTEETVNSRVVLTYTFSHVSALHLISELSMKCCICLRILFCMTCPYVYTNVWLFSLLQVSVA